MKKYGLALAFVIAVIGFALFSRSSNRVSAYAPPPASNLYALRSMGLKFILPPRDVVEPNQLRIAGERFDFNRSTGQFELKTAPSDLSVTTAVKNNKTLPPTEYYESTVRGFQLGGGGLAKLIRNLNAKYTAQASNPPPATSICILINCASGGPANYTPYEFKLTFYEPNRSTALTFANFLKDNPTQNDITKAYLSDRGCGAVNATGGTTLCTKTVVYFKAPGFAPATHTMTHAIPVFGGISVEGNVVGTDEVSGFVFDENSPKAIAVGGNVVGVTGGAGNVGDYANRSTVLRWDPPGTVGAKVAAIYNNNSSRAAVSSASTFTNVPIFLNSSNRNLRNSSTTTLSTPPEGKLWRVESDLTLRNVTVNGSGTIMVDGNVIINDSLQCATGARFGIVATGTITMNLGSGLGKIGCGAYVARGGNLVFGDGLDDPDLIYEAKGIFVTKSSIKLPSISDDVVFKIKYDNAFAADPTVLFKELLSIIFSTVS